MPEAFVIVAVLFVVGAAFVYARLAATNPATQNAQQDLARLHHQAAWLQDRLRIAQQEDWDREMVANLVLEHEAIKRQLTQAVAQSGTPAPQGR